MFPKSITAPLKQTLGLLFERNYGVEVYGQGINGEKGLKRADFEQNQRSDGQNESSGMAMEGYFSLEERSGMEKEGCGMEKAHCGMENEGYFSVEKCSGMTDEG